MNIYTVNCWKDEKRGREWPIKKFDIVRKKKETGRNERQWMKTDGLIQKREKEIGGKKRNHNDRERGKR